MCVCVCVIRASINPQPDCGVKLDIHGHEDFRREEIDFVHWSFHGQVVRYYPAKEKLYVPNNRVEFDSTNFSMILKNLQKSDSGLYRGEICVSENMSSTEYNLSVLGGFLNTILSLRLMSTLLG